MSEYSKLFYTSSIYQFDKQSAKKRKTDLYFTEKSYIITVKKGYKPIEDFNDEHAFEHAFEVAQKLFKEKKCLREPGNEIYYYYIVVYYKQYDKAFKFYSDLCRLYEHVDNGATIYSTVTASAKKM